MSVALANLRRALKGCVDLVYPRSCVLCRELVDGGPLEHVCERCAGQIDYVQPPCCTTCGHAFFGVVGGERLCPHCEGLRPEFSEGRTAVLLKGAARALVHELKYHRGFHVLRDVERVFRHSEHVRALAKGAVLVPVPLHPRKERERGFNQSELIADCLARALDGEARIERLLSRTVDTDSQTHHDRRTRYLNLKNAFAPVTHVVINPAASYVLIDDVFTTGSTLNSCARVLRRAGVVNLAVATFGHG